MSLVSAGGASRWFGPAGSPAGDAQVFVFPYAGGVAASFAQWQELAEPELSVHVALMPGRGARLHEPPVDDLTEVVDQLATAVTERASGPFLLFGHSLGALVAFEVARELRRRGAPAPLALLVGGAEAPQTRLVRRRVHDLDDTGLIDALRDFGATPAGLLADRELMELVLPGVRADFALSERYAYRPEPPLDLPVHVLLGDGDEHVDPDRAAGWARECVTAPRRHVFPGGHFFLTDCEPEIIDLMRHIVVSHTAVPE
ncbi:alpha/beta fold hydrolase [Micromonospora echinospora]|uniref:Medium-chain acyl-[acyl-carrier-protein] hydrolase n=1 Tax=Micromonospora echinospora TaxID=1877 RepID=A0ABR6MDP8_MICEC|nr:alpha/beta fold hydrolase [Micromonospora echinospora]MBB5113490.1 medium-chain acyl-[acyl-carrier-protein] hydrolase [Micromonospora echinospora]